MIKRVIHIKVRWAAAASVVAAVCTALAGSLGASAPGWLASVLTGVAAVLAGYAAPSGLDAQDPEAVA